MDFDKLVVGGQITEAGREAGLEDNDLAGGQIKPEAKARIEAAQAEDAEKPKRGRGK